MARRSLRFVLVGGVLALAVPLVAFATGSASWPSGGQNPSNTHSQSAESKISASNVQNLALKWAATTHGDVSAIPAVVNGAVYVPDWGPNYGAGYLNKFDADTGATIWSKPISDFTGVANDAARAAPVVSGNTIYLGDQGAQPGFPGGFGTGGGYLFAVNATSGAPIWKTKVDDNPFAIITSGALLVNGVLYVGVASGEEAEAAFTSDPCCMFRGSVVAVDAKTGQILWKTYTVPDNGGVGGGYSGGGVWGTTPAYDPQSKTVYATTGNNYSVPQSVKDCQANGGTAGQCLDPNDHIDSIMALDAATGQIKWATRLQEFDDWNVACIFGNPANCPHDPGPDFDFGSGPNLFTANGKLVVGAGQKSGIYFALDAKTGRVLWANQAGSRSTLGGIEWGPATDGKRIYIAEENFNGIPDARTGSTRGSWAALDPATGNTLWQVYDDTNNAFGGGNALGPVTVANGVVYAPSMSGKVRALDASTGATLWSQQLPGAAVGGAAVVNGVVYWGNGYTHLGLPGWNGNNKLYAFSLNGK